MFEYYYRTIPPPAILKGIDANGRPTGPLWTGKQMIALVMPPLFLEKTVRGGDDETTVLDYDERVVVIRNGALLAGALCKSTVGSASGGVIHVMALDYTGQITSNFMSDIQRMVNAWLMIEGFSVGISDCMIDEEGQQIVQKRIKRIMKKVHEIYKQVKHIPNLPDDAAEPPVFRTLAEVVNSAGIITVISFLFISLKM